MHRVQFPDVGVEIPCLGVDSRYWDLEVPVYLVDQHKERIHA